MPLLSVTRCPAEFLLNSSLVEAQEPFLCCCTGRPRDLWLCRGAAVPLTGCTGWDPSTELPFLCRPFKSRAKCTDPSANKCLVVDVDDEAVLSLIAECEWDLSNPPGSTSSSQKEREADFHSPQGTLLRPMKASRSASPALRWSSLASRCTCAF